MEYPMLIDGSSMPDEPMDFQRFRTTIKRLQYYDSFPGDGDSENQLHKIVKKQMTVSDYNDLRKKKPVAADLPESCGGDDDQCEDDRHAKRAASNSVLPESGDLTPMPRRTRSIRKKTSNGPTDAPDRLRAQSSDMKTPGKTEGGLSQELRYERCPKGQFFSLKQSRCLNLGRKRLSTHHKSRSILNQTPLFDNTPEEPEPANEWLDASKGVVQKIPSEFKPRKKPRLKIYHLRAKRKLEETVLQNRIVESYRGMGSSHMEGHKKLQGMSTEHGTRHHLPRSFVIRVNKKEGRGKNEKVTDGGENDEEDEEADEEEDEEDAEEEDAEEDDDFEKKTGEVLANRKESFKDLLSSAKAAVTSRVRFADTPDPPEISQKSTVGVKGKKSEATFGAKGNQRVLIDANIKVDGALTDILKNILKSTGIERDNYKGDLTLDGEPFDGGTKGHVNSELLRAFEHLARNDPRFKRHFLDSCDKKGD